MDLSIIILNFYHRDLIKYVIKNIKETVKTLQYEIIVVDNGTFDGVKDMLDDNYPEIKFIQNKSNIGFSAGNNSGIKIAQGEYIMVLNPDVFVLPSAIDDMVMYMRQHQEIGLLGPQLLNADKTLQLTCRRYQNLWSVLTRRTPLGNTKWGRKYLDWHLMAETDHSQTIEVDWVMGACQLVRRSDLDKVGLYEEKFQLYVEDMEWCLRFRLNSLKVVYYPQAKMIHLHEQGSKTKPWGFLKMNKLVRWHISSYLKFYFKYRNNKQYDALRQSTAR